jgi:hypothetical protein
MTTAAALAAGLALTACGGGARAADASPSTARPAPVVTPSTPDASTTPSPDATMPSLPAAVPPYPGLLLDPAQWDAIRAAVRQSGTLQATAWQSFLDGYVKTARDYQPVPTYTGSSDASLEQMANTAVSPASRTLRDLGIAYQVTLDPAYAQRVHDGLLAWAGTWRATDPTNDDSKTVVLDAANQLGPSVFSFAWAYDMTAASGAYTAAEQATLRQWFDGLAGSMWLDLQTLLTTTQAQTDLMVPYEWAMKDGSHLRYRMSDRYGPGNDFALRAQVGLVAAARVAGDRKLLWREYGESAGGRPAPAAQALAAALTPTNQGDGRDIVGKPAPEVLIAKAPLADGPDTTDYMTYNARMAGLLADESAGLHTLWPSAVPQDLVATWRGHLTTTWTYLARLFQPGAVSSPVHDYTPGAAQPTDVINYEIDTPRLWIGWHETGSARLWQVLTAGNNSPVDSLYEPEFLGPVTLVYSLR